MNILWRFQKYHSFYPATTPSYSKFENGIKNIPKIRIFFQSCPFAHPKIEKKISHRVLACEQKGGDRIV